MPAPLNVDREQVRMLVLAVGVREAARGLGIAEGTVQTWSANGKWLEDTRPTPAKLPPPASMRGSTGSTKPADLLAKTLKERKEHTKLGLSLYAARASRVASKLPKDKLLASASDIKAVADIAAKVWPEERTDGGMSLAFFSLSIGQEGAEKPVEGCVIDEDAENK